MADADQAAFVHNYSKVLVHAWTDKAYNSQLHEDPVSVLNEAGFNLPSNATVEITSATGAPDLKAQVDAWDAGKASGNYVLYVPDKPQLGVEESKDPSGLAQDTYCCCCSPCCTCT
jgi:hypothetical protein